MASYNDNYRYNYDYGVENLNNEDNSQVDVMKIVQKMLQKWYYFAISVPIFLVLGMVFLKSTPKVYLAGTTMMINPDVNTTSNLGSNQYLPGGIQLQPMTNNIANEIGLLRSRSLIKDALAKLDFDLAYMEKNMFLTKEVYQKSTYPFEVDYDKEHVQIAGLTFEIEPISNETFTLRFESDKYVRYDPTRETNTTVKSPIEYEQTHTFGQAIVTDQFSFTINRRAKGKFEEDLQYGFKIFSVDMLTDAFQALVDISRIPESNIISISGESSTPDKLIIYLNTLAETYIQRQLDKKNAFAEGTINFIREQLDESSTSLSDAENELTRAELEAGGRNAMDAGELLSKRNELEAERDKEQVKLRYLNNILTKLGDTEDINIYLSAPASIGINDVTLSTLIGRLADKGAEKNKIAARAGENSQEMLTINQEIADIKAQVKNNVTSQVELVQLDYDRLNRQIGQLNREIRNIPTARSNTAKARSRFEFKETINNYLQQRLAEAEISKAAADADSFVMDEARLLVKTPVSPKSAIILATMFILGLVLPALIIIGMDFFNNKISGEDEVKSLTNIPIVGTILHEKSPDPFFSEEYILSPLAESFRYLKVNVDYLLSTEMDRNVIGITSMVKGEGKTFTSSNLASIIALSGKRTIIVGSDIRRPQLYKRLRTENEIGLTNYLMGSKSIEEIIQQTSMANLDMIASGPIPPNPIEMLNSSRYGVLIEALKQDYDYVLVDTPPVGLVSDFLLLSKHTEVNLFVVRQNYSRVEFIKDLVKIRNNNNLDNIYLVINDVKYAGKGYGTRYGQRYDYGYLERGKSSNPLQLGKLKKKKKSASS